MSATHAIPLTACPVLHVNVKDDIETECSAEPDSEYEPKIKHKSSQWEWNKNHIVVPNQISCDLLFFKGANYLLYINACFVYKIWFTVMHIVL